MTLAAEAIQRTRAIDRATDLLSIAVERARQACFVDIIVGVVLFGYYAVLIWYRLPADLWPLIWALGITRAGDAIKGVGKSLVEAVQHARKVHA